MNSFGNETNWNKSVTQIANSLVNGTTSQGSNGFGIIYFSICIIMIPGFVTNVLAFGFIIKDVQKAVFPAIILLLALVCADLAAVTFITVHHSISQFVTCVTYPLCAVLSVLNTFFRLYSGVLNVMMCTDRVFAICAPYFYKRNIHVSTWKLGLIVSGLCTLMFAMFPVIGLGDVVKISYINDRTTLKCTTLYYRPEMHKKVSGILYGIFGLLIIIYIVVGNCMVIRSVFKMRQRVISLNPEPSTTMDSDPTTKANVMPFEIAFAKLMGGLAIVYLLSGAPYSVSSNEFIQTFYKYFDGFMVNVNKKYLHFQSFVCRQ